MSDPTRTFTAPDGRQVCASRQRNNGRWTVHVPGAGGRPVVCRDLTDALYELLNLHVGDEPRWLHDALDALSGYDSPLGRRFECPCCGYLTLTSPPSGTYELCPVCYWEDDGVQFRDPSYAGGANQVSLQQARKNFHRYGASEPRFRESVRAPVPEEARPVPER